jgi:predicted lipid-binding transport protein (Tim44 family)
MKRILPINILLVLLMFLSHILYARGGGGCLEKGTLVSTPSGPRPIETLKVGDTVLASGSGGLVKAKVCGLIQVQPELYYEIACGERKIKATVEHPVEVGIGEYKIASSLRIGGKVRLSDGRKIANGKIDSIARAPSTIPAFNLLVSPCGTYIANGIVVHNKGCFLPDTMIRKTDGGETQISSIGIGDRLLAFRSDGEISEATVQKILTHDVGEYLIVKTDKMQLRVTVEHPFYVGNGTFKTLEALKVGDIVFAFDGIGLNAQKIEEMTRVKENVIVYNLQTDAPNTFFANGIAVHNKGGGCFLPDTPVKKADGADIAIRFVRQGDKILAFNDDGKVLETSVQRVMTHLVDEYNEVRTDSIILHVTAEHPFFVGNGTFKTVGSLNAGDVIYAIDGNHLSPQRIQGIRKITESTLVYNLQTDLPNTYFANGIAVHNKGGGGFHGGGGHGGGSPSAVSLAVLGYIFAIIIVIIILYSRQGANKENLDFVYSPAKVALKSKKTLKLLEFISRQDPAVAPEKLADTARSTFLKLQECWQSRNYSPMGALMMPDLFLEHNKQIKGMIHNHEINIIGNLNIDRIDLVNVRYTFKDNQREFTALVTATAQDYYIDDRSRKMKRGDNASAQFQEFWTFQYFNGAWLLREIEQTRESDALKEENFFEQFTDVGLDQIYGDTAGKEGPAGPWLESDVEVKDTKIERMLNFLVQTDKVWNRQKMLETARRTFIEMMLTWESGEFGNIPKADLYPEVYDTMKEGMLLNQQRGEKVEFRNLCVRKVELVLVRNFDDNSKDEFVARVRAHAQKIMEQNGKVISQDDDVAPFEQYLTFGRVYNQWKLKEILLQADENGLVKQENVDQDSNAQQLQWYYQHRRAV